MMDGPQLPDAITSMASLGDPKRRRLYDLVAARAEPIDRDEAAAALDISRELAAFHLDRLVDAGLLEAEFHHRGERRGPGAGRPAKFYRRSADEVAISLPPRDYGRLAGWFAEALERSASKAAADAVVEIARQDGMAVGSAARRRIGRRTGRLSLRSALLELLADEGYEPSVDPGGEIRLHNCPYRAISTSHRSLTCGTNVAWAGGVVEGLGRTDLVARLSPADDRCCVIFQEGRARAKALP